MAPNPAARLDEPEGAVEDLRRRLEAAEDRERRLGHELQHRLLNMISTIRSVLRQSREAGASHDDFADHFEGRLDAIALYHARALVDLKAGVELEEVVREELLKVHWAEGDTCTIDGGSARLHGRTLELIGLAIHELTTNALKFGALAGGGRLAVSWTIETDDDGSRMVRFRWRETGVAMVGAAPRPSGFGRQLLEEALPYELDASSSFDLEPGGLVFSLDFPLPEQGDLASERTTDDLFVGFP